LARVRQLAPDTVRIMLTGNSDQQTAITAVNAGHIYRFLTKPCQPQTLARALTAGLQEYRLIRAERDLLEQTLPGSIQCLTEVLALVNPTAFGRANRVQRLVSQFAAVLQLTDTWQLEVAALLSQLGCVALPEETLEKVYEGRELTPTELHLLQSHAQVARDLIACIPRLEAVAEMIAYQEKRYNGGGPPHDGTRGAEIPLGGRVLKIALDYDKLAAAQFGRQEAYQALAQREGWYDPELLAALKV